MKNISYKKISWMLRIRAIPEQYRAVGAYIINETSVQAVRAKLFRITYPIIQSQPEAELSWLEEASIINDWIVL